MSQTTTTALPKAEADALEALYDATVRASQAFAAVQARIADGGQLQRLGSGAWIVTRTTQEELPEAPDVPDTEEAS